MNEIKIHDIKEIIEVPDFSFYIYYGLIAFAIILTVITFYFIYKLSKNKKINLRKEYYKILEELDLTNTKNSAYIITRYGYLLAQSEREKQLFHDLISMLEIYKYKKDVPNFNDEIKASLKRFMENLDI